MSKPAYVVYPAKVANHIVRKQNKEIERLNNIIKEAREYIHMNHKHFGLDEKDYIDITGLFKILDKVEENKDE